MKASQVISGSEIRKEKNSASFAGNTKLSKRRKVYKKAYWYKQKVKHIAQVDIPNKTVTCNYTAINHVPVPEQYYILQLIKLGFNIQLPLFPAT